MFTSVVGLVVSVLSFGGEVASTSGTPSLTTEHAARLYRIEVYNAYRLDRPEFDRRREQGERVLKSFQDAGQPHEQRDGVVNWFVAAREAAIAGGPLPSLPEFSQFVVEALPEQAIDGTVPVAASLPQEHPPIEVVPHDAVTTLDIHLPPGAEQVGPTRFLSTLVKGVFPRNTSAQRAPQDATTEPISIELPPAAIATPDTTPTKPVELPPSAPAKPKTVPAQKRTTALEPEVNDDPFAVKNLFEPATSPAETSEAATDADPFAP